MSLSRSDDDQMHRGSDPLLLLDEGMAGAGRNSKAGAAEARQDRDRPGRCHPLVTRVRGMADLLVEGVSRRLAGLFQAPAVAVVEPAVIDTPDPAILKTAVAEIRSAMRAVEAKEAQFATLVSEKEEILPEKPHGERRSTGW